MTFLDRKINKYNEKVALLQEYKSFDNNKEVKEKYPNVTKRLMGSIYELINETEKTIKEFEKDYFMNSKPSENINLDTYKKYYNLMSDKKVTLKETNKYIDISVNYGYERWLSIAKEKPQLHDLLYYNYEQNERTYIYLETLYDFDMDDLKPLSIRELQFSKYIDTTDISDKIIRVKFFKNGKFEMRLEK